MFFDYLANKDLPPCQALLMEVQTITTPKAVEECCVSSTPVGMKGISQGEKKLKFHKTSKLLDFHSILVIF